MFKSHSSIRVSRNGNSKQLIRGKPDSNNRMGVQTAAMGIGGGGSLNTGGSTNNGGFMGERVYISGIDVSTPYVDEVDHRTSCGMFRDIYLHDPVPGAAVDLMSNLPFSTFKLNIPSKTPEKIQEVYDNTLKTLKVQTFLPPIIREHMVFGFHTSMLVYKAATKMFTDTLPLPPQDVEVQSNMLFGHDPILRVSKSEMLSEFLADPSPTAKSIIDRLSPKMVAMLRTGNFELDPVSTLYYPRRAWAFQGKGESYYRRILPIYMLEKVLFRGTLTLANRRQSSILHVTAGSDEWEITGEELAEIVRGFQEADKDPIGSVVGTRNEVQVNEVRQGGDFWKYNDITQEMDGKKLLALGINEAFLSGDMNYNCLAGDQYVQTENGLIQIEQLVDTRERIVNKMHPLDIMIGSRFSSESAKGWLYNGYRRVFQVKTDSGNSIRATENHPVLVLTKGLETTWKNTGDVKVGDVMVLSTQELTRTEPLKLTLSDPIEFRNSDTRANRLEHNISVMTPEIAFAMGAIIAEGTFNNGRITIPNSDKHLLKLVAKGVDAFGITREPYLFQDSGKAYNIFGNAGVTTKKMYLLDYSSQQLSKWLEELGVTPTTSFYKEVPWSIMQADKESQLAFIAAYLECDGSINKNYGCMEMFSMSGKLISQMQLILNSHGVLNTTKENAKTKMHWLKINTFDAALLWPSLSKYMVSKSFNYAEYNCKSRNRFGIPVAKAIKYMKKRFITSNRFGAFYLNDKGKEVHVVGGRWPGESTNLLYDAHDNGFYDKWLAALKVVNSKFHDNIVELLKYRYRFTTVVAKLKQGKEHVYDITMGGNKEPAFVAQGLIVHNTMEHALSVFMENLRAMREEATHQIFYHKLFPLISITNGFTKAQYSGGYEEAEITAAVGATRRMESIGIETEMMNMEDYIIPKIEWDKKLMPEGDEEQLSMLEKLEEKGMPLSLRSWAAAGGVDIDLLMKQKQASIDDEIRIKQIEQIRKKRLDELNLNDSAMKTGGSGEDDDYLSSYARRSTLPEVPILSRKYKDSDFELYSRSATGKKHFKANQERAHKNANRVVAATLQRMSVEAGTVPKKYMMSGKKKQVES